MLGLIPVWMKHIYQNEVFKAFLNIVFSRFTEGVKLKVWIVAILSFMAKDTFAQLDSVHYLPPMHARVDWGPQYLYISTPEKTPFPVTITDGTGAVISTVTVSNSQPYKYNISSSNDNYTLVPEVELHKALKNRGIVMEAKKKFYAYYKAVSSNQNQACDLTCKGRAALGKSFRVGHLLQEVDNTSASRANFVGVMASEDSTVVTFSGFDPNTDFRKSGSDVPSAGPEKITLQKGESVVFAQYLNASSANQPPNGFMGGLIEATKPVAVNTGSWCGGPVASGDKDAGIDQIAPLENVGKEYILCRGNGSDVLERPIIVAHFDNTQVWINGSAAPVVTLRAGQYYVVPSSNYGTNNNIHIRSSQPVFVYQMIGGANSGGNEYRTAGLIFVPPISCSIANIIDNIADPNIIGTLGFDGGLMVTAMRDSLVTVTVDGSVVNLGTPASVSGNTNFVTYRALSIFSKSKSIGTIKIEAQGAVQIAMYGQNAAASYAAFYSGFSKTIEPRIELTRVGDGICPDTLVATGLFDGVQWVYADSILKYGKDTFLIVYAPGRYIATGYLGVCRQSETANDTLDVSFISPQFPYAKTEPSCYGYTDGQIRFGVPSGGLAPYQFSIDNGLTFSKSSTYTNIGAGVYKLIVRDSLGCYNSPLELKVGQPSILTTEIIPLTAINDDVKIGQTVKLSGTTNRAIKTAVWSPLQSDNCTNCLSYSIMPTLTTLVTLTVTDSLGCRAADSILLRVQPNVFAPNVFYPYSQNGNDHFILYSKESLPVVHLAIFDRWGELVFDVKNISTNVLEQGWDATFRGKKVESDVYVYFAEVEVLPGKTIMIKGDVTVLY